LPELASFRAAFPGYEDTTTRWSSPRTPAPRAVWSAKHIRSEKKPAGAHERQSQLRERHRGVRPGPRRGDRVRPVTVPGSARGR